MSNDTPVRFGVIGYGLFGTHHARSIAEGTDSELVSIAVKSESSQSKAKEAHPSTDVVSDYRSLLDRNDIEAVSIVAPNQLHHEIGKAALEAGKHVLLEKPMALRVDHCDELIAIAESKGLTLAVGHELRLSSLWGGAKDLIDQGAIGEPMHALIELSRFPYRQGAEGWRYDIDRVGSWILEEPIHFFDLARWYLSSHGDPTSIYARANSRHADDPRLQDNFSAIMNVGPAYAVVSQTLSAFGHHQTGKITGTEGTIWAWWSAADARSDKVQFGLSYGLGDKVTEVSFDKPTGELLELADQITTFAHCVRTGSPPPCTGNDGRWSTLLCLAAEQSAATGTLIPINEFIASGT